MEMASERKKSEYSSYGGRMGKKEDAGQEVQRQRARLERLEAMKNSTAPVRDKKCRD